MSPILFWKTTPRKLNMLLKIHNDINSTKGDTQQSNVDSTELRNNYLRNKGLGAKSYGAQGMPVPKQPDCFVDQLPFMK